MYELETLCLLGIGICAVFMDISKQKIPNLLIVTGLGMGLWYQILCRGSLGIVLFLGGAMLPLILLSVLYYFRMLGAGDIKLFAVVGGFLGVTGSVYCLAFSFLSGAVLALFFMIVRKNLWVRLEYFLNYTKEYLTTGRWKAYRIPEDKASHMHFSVPILFGVLLRIGGIY